MQDSRRENRTQSGPRRTDGNDDKVALGSRIPRAVPASDLAPPIRDEASARSAAQQTMGQILSMPALAASAQANSAAEAVLGMLR